MRTDSCTPASHAVVAYKREGTNTSHPYGLQMPRDIDILEMLKLICFITKHVLPVYSVLSPNLRARYGSQSMLRRF